MSVPMFDVSALWRMPCDEFNEWRATTDLPILYEYFLQRLPEFPTWAAEFNIDKETFSRTIPTATLLLGQSVLTLVPGRTEQTQYFKFWPTEMEPEEYVRRCTLNGHPVPDVKRVVPYLMWGAKRFGQKNFIPNDNAKVAGIVFNSWSGVNAPEMCRASIFRDFAVLKLGAARVEFDLSGRNLDFADLDYLVVTGDYHANKRTYVQYSSCRNLTISNAHMAFYEFRRSWMNDFVCNRSNLYSMAFVDCDQLEVSFADSKLRKIRFDRCGAAFDFDHCELIDVVYEPPKFTRMYSFAIEVYRQLRTAYQSCGKRHEAAEAYFQERCLERKALRNPYFEPDWERMFPPRRTGDSAGQAIKKWRDREYDIRTLGRRMLQITAFHARLWLIPRYALVAFKFKFRYLMSLIEALIWGYGERPSRIIATAVTLLTAYSVVFYALLNKGYAVTVSLVDCAYLSIVTFTTLGYGDITPKTTLMKMACGSEAAVGAFVIGLVVAGFANRSRY